LIEPGQLSLRFSSAWMPIRVVHESHCPEIGPICARRDEPSQLHDQTFQVAELRAMIEYGLAAHWSVEVQAPLRLTATRIRYRRLDGTVFEPDYPNIHHRNETLVGLADPSLAARSAWLLGGFQITTRLGSTLPLGRTEPNPFTLGELGFEHQHLQFGTGTFNPILGLEVLRTLEHWELQGYAHAMLTVYQNAYGYRAGHRIGGGLSADRALFGPLRAAAALDVLHEEPERWGGEVMQDGNLGRTGVLVGGSLTYSTSTAAISLTVKLPVYQHIVQVENERAELSYPIILGLNVGTVVDREE
jgi:hypothetical protein